MALNLGPVLVAVIVCVTLRRARKSTVSKVAGLSSRPAINWQELADDRPSWSPPALELRSSSGRCRSKNDNNDDDDSGTYIHLVTATGAHATFRI